MIRVEGYLSHDNRLTFVVYGDKDTPTIDMKRKLVAELLEEIRQYDKPQSEIGKAIAERDALLRAEASYLDPEGI